ncbi:hypothetical protein N9J12_05835 [Alphaproteobacteria bacterium]|nr:hypothetical protein [Alphaproteobacteria bacterium]
MCFGKSLPSLVNNQYFLALFLLFVIVPAGFCLRYFVSTYGYNVDMEAFWETANIIANGGNVYASTEKYNYGPLWGEYLGFIVDFFSIPNIEKFRLIVAISLSFIDIAIAILLFSTFGFWPSVLFFLNPISIFSSGFHGQFDVAAIALSFLSVVVLTKYRGFCTLVLGLCVLGASLSVKHILFLFPLWLFFHYDDWRWKILSIVVPYSIFIFSFLPYLPEGYSGIVNNVLLYRSFNNAPFWSLVLPHAVYTIMPKIVLFVSGLVLIGYLFRSSKPTELFLVYLAFVFMLSSAIALQYLVIPLLFICVYWNRAFFLYVIGSSALYLAHIDGFALPFMRDFVGWNGRYGIHVIMIFFTIGILTRYGLVTKLKFIRLLRMIPIPKAY